jgi:hypothetical protein
MRLQKLYFRSESFGTIFYLTHYFAPCSELVIPIMYSFLMQRLTLKYANLSNWRSIKNAKLPVEM